MSVCEYDEIYPLRQEPVEDLTWSLKRELSAHSHSSAKKEQYIGDERDGEEGEEEEEERDEEEGEEVGEKGEGEEEEEKEVEGEGDGGEEGHGEGDRAVAQVDGSGHSTDMDDEQFLPYHVSEGFQCPSRLLSNP